MALLIVGADRLPASGYLRAKVAQENLIKASGIPFTIVRSTQFFEFAKSLVESATEGQTVRLSPALFQPIAADDVAAALTGFALAEPLNGTAEIAGPESIRMDEFARRFCVEQSRSDRLIFHQSRQCANANQVIAKQAFGNADYEDEMRPLSVFAEWNSGPAAPDADHNFINQIRARMRKRDAVFDHARMRLLTDQ